MVGEGCGAASSRHRQQAAGWQGAGVGGVIDTCVWGGRGGDDVGRQVRSSVLPPARS